MARRMAARMIWYRQSLSDRDTHCGHLLRGRVLAACGVEFSPLRARRTRGPALPGEPSDPEQVCPECQRTRVKTPGPGHVG